MRTFLGVLPLGVFLPALEQVVFIILLLQAEKASFVALFVAADAFFDLSVSGSGAPSPVSKIPDFSVFLGVLLATFFYFFFIYFFFIIV